MKILLYTCLLFLCPFYLHAQLSDQYKNMVKQAETLYNNKQYKESAESYLAAFHSGAKMLQINDVYNASRSMAKAGMIDSAFAQLNFIAQFVYTDYETLSRDTNLVALHADARWDALCKKVKENKDKKDKEEANYNKALMAILDTIYTDDQAGRQQLDATSTKFGRDSKEFKELWTTIKEKDSTNVLKVTKILDQYGWLGADIVSPQGNRTIFLVIQHADQKTQEKYLPMMREAVKNHKARASHLALLEDRLALRQGKKQIYGSQIGTTKDGQYYIEAMDDPDNVDKRRAAVGLGPLADYVKSWNLKWDPEVYKKQLTEIEKKEKEAGK